MTEKMCRCESQDVAAEIMATHKRKTDELGRIRDLLATTEST